MSIEVRDVLIRQFGAMSYQWEGPITLTLNGKDISWSYDSTGQKLLPENTGKILRWVDGGDCRKMNTIISSNPLGSKKYRIDISLKVFRPVPSNPNHTEIGKPYAFAFKNESDYNTITDHLIDNIGQSDMMTHACNLSSMGYGKGGFENFLEASLKRTRRGGGKRKRKSKTKRKTTKRKKIQKKKKTKKRRKSSKRK